MDRTLKIYAKTGHLFGEITFDYEQRQQLKAKYTEYRRLYDDDEEDEDKRVYDLPERDIWAQYREFKSIDEIKAWDIDFVKKEFGRDMKDTPASYTYAYDATPVLLRYVAANHVGVIGMVNIMFGFIENTKEVKFLSGTHPRFDVDISANSLETNLSCILRIPVYTDRDTREISAYDLKRLPAWY